jgi:hypothetical protein
MAIGKEMGNFSFKVTSVTYGDASAQVNLHGSATGFGTVEGTLTFMGEPGAKSGTCSWRGTAYMDNGETKGGTAEGSWETVGKHKWRVRGLNRLADGQTFLSDGEVDLASQSYNGKLYEC